MKTLYKFFRLNFKCSSGLLIKDILCIHFKQTLLISLPIIFHFMGSVFPTGICHQVFFMKRSGFSALVTVVLVCDLRKQTTALFGRKKNLITVVK